MLADTITTVKTIRSLDSLEIFSRNGEDERARARGCKNVTVHKG